MANEQIKVGLIGYGMAGHLFHAPFITAIQGLELATIRETKDHNIATIKERYPNTAIVDDTKKILDDNKIDLVVVASPNLTHYQLAKEALLAGKNVVVDKPFTVRSSEADELIG